MDEELRTFERDDPQSQRYFAALLRSGKACRDYAIVGGDSLSDALKNMNEQCQTPDYCLHPRALVAGVELMRPLTFSETLESSLSDCMERDLYMTSTAVKRYAGSNRLKIVQCYPGCYDYSAKPFEECEGVDLTLKLGTNCAVIADVQGHDLWKALIPDYALREKFAGFIDKKIRFSFKSFLMPTIPENGIFHFQLTFGRLTYAICSPASQASTLLIRKLRRSSGAWFYPLKYVSED